MTGKREIVRYVRYILKTHVGCAPSSKKQDTSVVVIVHIQNGQNICQISIILDIE